MHEPVAELRSPRRRRLGRSQLPSGNEETDRKPAALAELALASGRESRFGCAAWLVGAYLLLAIYVWFDFTSINHDGLANVGLMLVTAPVTLFGLAISGSGPFALMPSRYGYLTDHALYYVPAAAITAFLLWLVGRWIDRRRGPGKGGN